MEKKLIILIFWLTVISGLVCVVMINCCIDVKKKYNDNENINKIRVCPKGQINTLPKEWLNNENP
jgi:hypothetical protein